MRPLLLLIATSAAALGLAACGTADISVSTDDPNFRGASLFAERCSGCHTLSAAGTQGSGSRAYRAQGPNFDEREESFDDALYAIRNGGFSGAIMPQNIVVGEDAERVAQFLADTSGSDVDDALRPSSQEEEDLNAEESGKTPPDETTTTGSGE